jgi:hypothetical protein
MPEFARAFRCDAPRAVLGDAPHAEIW